MAEEKKAGRRHRGRVGSSVFGAAATLVGLAAMFAYAIIGQIQLEHHVAVTAHRGSSRAASENTMAATLQAIEEGEDYAEIDVQEMADDAVVLLRDKDLRRMANRTASRRNYER